MAFIHWPEWLDDRDHAYIYSVTAWWIHREQLPERFDRLKTRPDDLERRVVNCALLSLAVALKQALKKLRRGEAIPFDEVRMAATGQLRRDFIRELWERLGRDRGMTSPLVRAFSEIL